MTTMESLSGISWNDETLQSLDTELPTYKGNCLLETASETIAS